MGGRQAVRGTGVREGSARSRWSPALRLLIAALLIRGSSSTPSKLLPDTQLVSGCYDFPVANFNRLNCVRCSFGSSPSIIIREGESAVDFTLHTVDGVEWNLRKALVEKPVVMIWGMSTCPAFEGMGVEAPWDACAYWDENDLIRKWSDRVFFVHLYGPEPHPMSPDTNFDSGLVKTSYWSTVRQPRTWEDRLELARSTSEKVHPSSTFLVDYLEGNPYEPALNQPVWCTYGHGARIAVLIGQDGLVQYAQEWFQADRMATAVEAYLGVIEA
jgi:hypothetical protein